MTGERNSAEQSEWKRYSQTGDIELRNRLAERHIPLVHHIAIRVAGRSGSRADLEDLVSAGILGLLWAVTAFDPARGYRFSTFAGIRIRGAMLDELRRRDVAPRSVRRRQRAMESASDRLTVELDRRPRHPELAMVLGVDVQTLWRWKWEVAQSQEVSLTALQAVGPAGASAASGLAARQDGVGLEGVEAVEAGMTRDAEARRLRHELGRLTDRERQVIELYDMGSLTLREVGERLGVTESRVSQIRTQALGVLRNRMKDMREAA